MLKLKIYNIKETEDYLGVVLSSNYGLHQIRKDSNNIPNWIDVIGEIIDYEDLKTKNMFEYLKLKNR